MKDLIKKYKKDLIVLGSGNFLKILFTILLTRLVTYFLNYEEYAKFILVISIYYSVASAGIRVQYIIYSIIVVWMVVQYLVEILAIRFG